MPAFPDHTTIGPLEYRDHRDDSELRGRQVERGVRADDVGGDGRTEYVDPADVLWGYWPPEKKDPDRQGFGSIASAFPAWALLREDRDETGMRPARDYELDDDEGYRWLDLIEEPESSRVAYTPSPPPPQTVPDSEGDKQPGQEARVRSVTGRRVAEGAPGVVLPGTRAKAHAALFFPAWDGVLIAQHRDGAGDTEPEYSTRVVDLADSAEKPRAYDDEDVAGLHSVWRVQRLPGATPSGQDMGNRAIVTWLGTRAMQGSDDVGYAAMHMLGNGAGGNVEGLFDTTSTVTRRPPTDPPGLINCFLSHECGGPIHPGAMDDAHSLGGTGRPGDAPWNAAHLNTRALWWGGSPQFDAPLDFLLRFEPQGVLRRRGALTRVDMMIDPRAFHAWAGGGVPGLWRWHVAIPVTSKTREPFPGGGGVEVGGSFGSEDGEPPLTPTGRDVFTAPRGGVPLKDPPSVVADANVHGSPRDWAIPSLTFRAQPYCGRRYDTRHYEGDWDEDYIAAWEESPVVARLEAFGRESRCGEWPADPDANPRWFGAQTAAGSLAILPGGIGLEDIANGATPAGRTAHTAYLGAVTGYSRFAVGTPIFSGSAGGSYKTGYELYGDTSGDLVMRALDSAGAATERAKLTQSGRMTAVQHESTVTTGTAPLVVASTTVVTNFNADLLDGSHASAFEASGAAAAAVAAHEGAADPHTGYLRESQNLVDLADAGTARTNLSVYSQEQVDNKDDSHQAAAEATAAAALSGHEAAADPHTGYLQESQNLNDLPNKTTARTNLSVYSIAQVDGGFASLSHTHGVTDILFGGNNKILGRTSPDLGNGVEIDCTAAGRALIDDADAAAQRTTLGLGTMATEAGAVADFLQKDGSVALTADWAAGTARKITVGKLAATDRIVAAPRTDTDLENPEVVLLQLGEFAFNSDRGWFEYSESNETAPE